MEHHRAGKFKQHNKAHKAAKKANYAARKLSTSSNVSCFSKRSSDSRRARLNKLKQYRNLKRQELQNAKRNLTIAPILISVYNFGKSRNTLFELIKSLHPDIEVAEPTTTGAESLQFYHPSFRSKYHLVLLDPADLNSSLDLCRISDALLVNFNVESFLGDTYNEKYFSDNIKLLDSIYHLCLPTTVYGITGSNIVTDPKVKDRARKNIRELVEEYWFGSLDGNAFKLRSLDTASDLSQLFHYFSNIKRKPNSYCSRRSQLLAERIAFNANEDNQELGELTIEGYVRNNPLNVNSLVYIPGFGEFQMSQLETVVDPPLKAKQLNVHYVLKADPEIRPSLESQREVHTIDEDEAEDRDEEELAEANLKPIVEKRKVPKGTSDYQASWIVDSEGELSDIEEDENEEEDVPVGNKDKVVRFAPLPKEADPIDEDEEGDDMESMVDKEEDNNEAPEAMDYDDQLNMEEESQMLQQFKEQRVYEMFPDEIDTPSDRPARERFAKYRGLKSFRTSTWDAHENLPADYSKIFQFENFNRTRRRLFKTEATGAEVGHYVRLYLINVPRKVFETFEGQQRPLVVYELLAHEHRMSVMNIVLKKVNSYSMPVRSKEKLTFHVGCRRFVAAPTFSAHTTGDKHKFERFLGDDVACVATIYAPITFPPASVLVFRGDQLVATGSLADCSPDRLIIKRLLLSGHPFKINRKHAVVRYMFFNREDILWFRPIELRTKYGRKGHILEPLGTHGHMKCTFNRQLTSQDTVLMPIYKRVFPKWCYETLPEHDGTTLASEANEMDMN